MRGGRPRLFMYTVLCSWKPWANMRLRVRLDLSRMERRGQLERGARKGQNLGTGPRP
jgi:hypothetical protein